MKKIGFILGVVIVLIGAIIFATQVGDKEEALFSLAAGDHPTWDFEGSYEASEELTLRAQNELERLKGLLDGVEFSKYDVEIGIAQQYLLLGEGKGSYEHLLLALNINDKKPVAYLNLGNLLGKVGALESGKVAHEEALDRADTVQNRILYVQYLEQYFGDNLKLVESAHTFAIEKFPNSEVLEQRYESWKNIHDK